MHIELYADILFFINFFMLYIIFFIVNNFVKLKVSIRRIFFTSILTSITYVFTIIYVPFDKTFSIFIILCIIIFSILVCFKITSIKDFFKTFILVNIVSFCIGGFSIALFYYTNIGSILTNINSIANFTINNFSSKILLASISGTYIFLKLSLKYYKNIVVKKQIFYNLKLYNNGKNITINSLLDTGNSLKEPISQKPVIIAEFLAIKDILPNSIKILFYEKQEHNLEKILENSTGVDLRFIPFKSIGEENGMLLGIKIDKLEIFSNSDFLNNDYSNNNFYNNDNNDKVILFDVIVAICNFSLSKDNFYNCLLNPEMLE